MSALQVMLDSYLETALWSSSDWDDMDDCDNPTPYDENFDIGDFEQSAVDAARADCERFIEALYDAAIDDDSDYDSLYDAADDLQGDSRIGHDLWLTRNGHGAGFWDGDYGDYGDEITELVHATFGRYSELNIFTNESGGLEFDG